MPGELVSSVTAPIRRAMAREAGAKGWSKMEMRTKSVIISAGSWASLWSTELAQPGR